MGDDYCFFLKYVLNFAYFFYRETRSTKNEVFIIKDIFQITERHLLGLDSVMFSLNEFFQRN